VDAVEQEQSERLSPEQRESPSLAFGPVLALLACLLGAWIAAGSIGLLAHPLRRVLVLLALGVALLAPDVGAARRWLRVLLTPLVAIAAAWMVTLPTPAANVMAVALVGAFLAFVSARPAREVLSAASTAIALFGLTILARTSIPWLWLVANGLGRTLGALPGVLTSHPLHVGATFGGLDFLILMGLLWALCLRHTATPRIGRTLYGCAGILIGHLIYLMALSGVPTLLEWVPQPTAQSDFSLAGLLHHALPWNAPALAGALQLVVAGAILRWSDWTRPIDVRPARRPAISARVRAALVAAALAMAILLPVVTLLHTQPPGIAGKRIVFYEKGFLNWLKPTHDSYGRLSSGMYGMLRPFVESLGAESLISADLSEDDLREADALVLLFPNEPWADGQLERIGDFARRGGAVLVMGEHTTRDPNGTNRFNDVLAPTRMKIRFDSATFAIGGWLHSYETLDHPVTTGVPDDRNQFGVVIGASVQARWPARPLLAGRWGWADPGDESSSRAMMGNGRYDGGEQLGDIVLAAEQPMGKGKIIAFGDTSSLQNAINVSSHAFNARLFAYLTGNMRAHPWWRQCLGISIVLFLMALLSRRSVPWKTALIVIGLTGSLAVCHQSTVASATTGLLPDGRSASPNNLAYIDASHLPAYSGESWRPDGIGGLALTLMRNGYLALTLPELTSEALDRAGLLVSIAPARSFSEAEIEAVIDFVNEGGTFIVTTGYDSARASLPLLKQFGFSFGQDALQEPAPLGHFKSPYLESEDRRVYVRFHAAWPIRCTDPNARVIANGRDNQPVIIARRIGAGRVILVGDTGFAMNKNLEQQNGQPFEGLRENADFWRWLISTLHDEPMWIPPALHGTPAGEVTP